QTDDPDEEEMEAEGVQAKPTEAEAAPERAQAEAHEEPEGPLERDTPKLKLITGAYVATVVLVVICVIATRQVFLQTIGAELKRKVAEPVSQELTDLRASEHERLNNYQWIDQQRGVVRMPADRAKAIVLTHYSQIPIEPVVEENPEIDDEPPPPPEPKGEGGGAGAGGGDGAGEDGAKPGDEKKDEKGEEKKGDEKKPEEKKGDEKKPEEKKPEKKQAPTGGGAPPPDAPYP
ncbi:MAG: hypothetical protein HOV80_35250, partial [Polyangiaceae bacterium]|nr:hypothetical protein [Polyangiaceae bacterium]